MIMNNKVVAGSILMLATLSIFAQSAFAEGDLDSGEELAYSCLGCHGIEGYRNAYPSYRVPKLGGQKAAYLEIALRGYRDGNREHPTMEGQAESLSDQDIADVAAYFASMPGATDGDGQAAESAPEAAQACAACHGPAGISVNAMWPSLAGQHEDYLLQSLKGYRDGTRKDPVMSTQATLIDEDDVEILARYFADLEGLATTKVD